MYRLAIKTHHKKTSRKNGSVSFFTTTRVLIYSVLLAVDDAMAFGRHA